MSIFYDMWLLSTIKLHIRWCEGVWTLTSVLVAIKVFWAWPLICLKAWDMYVAECFGDRFCREMTAFTQTQKESVSLLLSNLIWIGIKCQVLMFRKESWLCLALCSRRASLDSLSSMPKSSTLPATLFQRPATLSLQYKQNCGHQHPKPSHLRWKQTSWQEIDGRVFTTFPCPSLHM